MRTHPYRAALVPLLLVVATACDRPSASADQPPPSATPAPVKVRLAEVVATDLAEPIFGTGVLAADKTTLIGPAVDGILETVLAQVGDRIRRGQALFRLRTNEYRVRVDRERAAVALAEAELAQTELDLSRIEQLRRDRVVSDDRRDDAVTAARIAGARLDRARAELAAAEQALRDTTTRAPYDGVVTRRFADEGAFVRAAPGAGVLEVQKVDLLVAVAYVPELALPRLTVGTPARVRIDGLDREVASMVGIINDRVDESAHTVELRVPLPNPELDAKPGLFVKIELLPAPRSALVLDRRAVSGTTESGWVWSLGSAGAQRRAVGFRELDRERVEILSGLAAGDRVLVPIGDDVIEAGAPLELETIDAPG